MSKITIEIDVDDLSKLEKDCVIRVRLSDLTVVMADGPTVQAKEAVKLSTCMQKMIDRNLAMGKERTAETYQSTLRSFSRFLDGREILLSEMDRDMMRAYEADMRSKGIALNTSSFYLRKLRAVYNRAVEEGLVDDVKPFKDVYTGRCSTRKRAVGIDMIRKIRDYQPKGRTETLAQGLFLFSFYTRGMPFVDMAHLKKTDLAGGYLTYQRRKTGQRLTVRWEKDMQEVVDRLSAYANEDSVYLLPVIKHGQKNERGQCRSMQLLVNKGLKRISKRIGMEYGLTLYVARHSWASIARGIGVSMSVISQALGHTTEKTTQIYLQTLDRNVIDQANMSVIEHLKHPV